MPTSIGTLSILLADDDAEDRADAQAALDDARLEATLTCVEDGRALLDHLRRQGILDGAPAIILLDLNMPRLDGLETLEQLKTDEALRRIPVLVLTTSRADKDVFDSYGAGASSFITKPITFAGKVELMKSLHRYWSQTVVLPAQSA